MEELLEKRYNLLQSAAKIREKIGGRRLPKLPDPSRKATHWDYILQQMKWMATDFIQERKHRLATCFVISHQIKDSKDQVLASQSRRQIHQKTLSFSLSNLVQFHFAHLQKQQKEFQQKQRRQFRNHWKVYEVNTFNQKISIFLQKVKPPLQTQQSKDTPINSFIKRVASQFSFSKPNILNQRTFSSPSTATTNLQNQPQDLNQYQYQLFYDTQNLSSIQKDLLSQLQPINTQELDLYAPLFDNQVQFRDISYQNDMIDRELYILLPDIEQTIFYQTLKFQQQEQSELPAIVRYQSEFYPFPTLQVKKEWKISDDMELERLVSEYGGVWPLIGDLLASNYCIQYDYYHPEEVSYRWNLLQRRKGRNITESFKPFPVLQVRQVPLQDLVMGFSLLSLENCPHMVAPNIQPHITDFEVQNQIDYLFSNLDFQSTSYFTQYQKINQKYYSGQVLSQPYRLAAVKEETKISDEFMVKTSSKSENVKILSPLELIEQNGITTKILQTRKQMNLLGDKKGMKLESSRMLLQVEKDLSYNMKKIKY